MQQEHWSSSPTPYLHRHYYTSYPEPTQSQESRSAKEATRAAPLPTNPSTAPNAYTSFQDTEATPTLIPRAREVLDDKYIADSDDNCITEPETENADLPEHVKVLTGAVETIMTKIRQLERIARTTPPAPTCYNNDPALVEKVATLM